MGKKTYYFDDLLQAISSSVHSTNELSQSQYSGYVDQHFTTGEDGVRTPNTLNMLLPADVIEEGEAGEQVHEVPTASLSNPQTVAIDELEVDFECSIKGLESGGEENGAQRLSIELGSRGKPWQQANVRIKFKNSDPPEGLAQVNDSVLKKF